MQLWRFIKCMFGITLLALIYIHMQMNIFSLAYKGKEKEQHVVRLKEQNSRVSNNIFELKSASYLGRKMFTENGSLKFRDGKNIVKVITVKRPSSKAQLASNQKNKNSGPLSKFLQWRFPREAQAKERKSLKPWERERR